MAAAPNTVDKGTELVRRFRILEYVGSRRWVEATTDNPNRYVAGCIQIGDATITEHLTNVEVIQFGEVKHGG
jgi:hypothetical protein